MYNVKYEHHTFTMYVYMCVRLLLHMCRYMLCTFVTFCCSFHESMKRLTLSTPLRGSTELSSHTHYTLTPPHSLLDYPPLASLTNALVSAFNELRQCAPLAMGPEVAQELRRLLESIVHDVREYHRYVSIGSHY